jgi:hypothetical protein
MHPFACILRHYLCVQAIEALAAEKQTIKWSLQVCADSFLRAAPPHCLPVAIAQSPYGSIERTQRSHSVSVRQAIAGAAGGCRQ